MKQMEIVQFVVTKLTLLKTEIELKICQTIATVEIVWQNLSSVA